MIGAIGGYAAEELVYEDVTPGPSIVDECYGEVLRLLNTNRDRIDRLVDALVERETIDEDDVYRVEGVECDRVRNRMTPRPGRAE